MSLMRTASERIKQAWPKVRKYVIAGFFILVTALLLRLAFTVDWREVHEAFRAMSIERIMIAAALAIGSYAVYCSYDLLGKWLTGHSLPVLQVLKITFVSYSFNLSFGALIGGTAFRFRLYSQAGLKAGVITRILAMSIVTNWIGYLLLAGIMLATQLITLPESWVGGGVLRLVGVGLIATFVGYLWLVLFSDRSEIHLHGHQMPLPDRKMVFLQVGLSVLNWSLIGLIVYTLLPEGAAVYPVVLGALLVSAIAGVITHVPAGLGVIEAVFIAMLAGSVPQGQLLASLLAYRVVYYLAPLGLGAIVYAYTEASRRASAVTGQT